MSEREDLEQAIATLEAQRSVLGTAVEAVLAGLRLKLAALEEGVLEAPANVGERRLVTTLFCDVEGSTALAEKLDPEEWAEIMNGAFEFLIAPVKRYEGTVTRLMGDAVLAIFGAPVAHEDDPERAVLAGLEMVEGIGGYRERLQRERGLAFNVRVGINTGLVVVGAVGSGRQVEYTVMGDAVNVAARMEQTAQPGTVQIAETTYRLVARLFEIEELGAVDVRGKAERVPAYRVTGRRKERGETRGIEGLRAPLTGREAELQLVKALVEQVRRGDGALAVVMGEAGLGKSRLMAETREWLTGDTGPKVAWLEGRAISYGQSISFYPWQQILRQSIGVREGASAEAARQQLRLVCRGFDLSDEDCASLEVLLGAESDATLTALGKLEGDAVTERLAAATKRYLAALAQRVPTVIVFDDLHWADDASVELLAAAAQLVETQPLLLVGVLRPDREAASWSFVERTRAQLGERFTAVVLDPLTADKGRELLASLLQIEDLPDTVRGLILDRAEGNPFFVEEIIRALITSGQIVRENDRWHATREVASVVIPETLAGVLSARIDRLPESTKFVAQAAAVIGRIFPHRVLNGVYAATQRGGRNHLDEHLSTLLAAEMIRERVDASDREFVFKHALTHEATYNSLLIRRRKELHRATGAVLEQQYRGRVDEVLPLLAYHFWHGDEWEQAAEYSLRAGARAMGIYALGQAFAHYECACDALEKLPTASPEREVDAILKWTEAAYRLRRYDEIWPRLTRAEQMAREQNDKRRLALTLHWAGAVHLATGTFSQALPALAENARLADEIGDERLSVVPRFFTAAALVDRDPRAAVEQLTHVIESARALQDKEIEAHTLGLKAMAHARLGEFAEAHEAMQHAFAVATRTKSTLKEADVDLTAGLAYYDMGDLGRGLEHSRRGAETARAQNVMECTVAGLFCVGLGNLLQQSWAEALTTFEEAVMLAKFSGLEGLNNQVRAGLAVAQFLTGRREAITDIEQALANAEAFEDRYLAAYLSLVLGEGYMQLRQYERAEQALQTALGYYREYNMRPYQVRALEVMARLYDREARDEEAEAVRGEIEAIREVLEVGAVAPGEGAC